MAFFDKVVNSGMLQNVLKSAPTSPTGPRPPAGGSTVVKKGLGSIGDRVMEIMRKQRGLKSGGKVSSASKRADGIATKGKTKGRII